MTHNWKNNNKLDEAIAALQVLGYNRKEIEKKLQKFDINNITIEEIIKKLTEVLF